MMTILEKFREKINPNFPILRNQAVNQFAFFHLSHVRLEFRSCDQLILGDRIFLPLVGSAVSRIRVWRFRGFVVSGIRVGGAEVSRFHELGFCDFRV